MKRLILVVTLCFGWQLSTFAQDFGGGFKVGMNASKIYGDSEMDADGNALETMNTIAGFHVGGMVGYKFTKKIGVRAELLFVQKGGKYKYEGDGFQSFTLTNGNIVQSTGTRSIILNYTNNYIELPLMFNVYPVSKLRISAGLSFAAMVSSQGNGETKYSGTLANGSPVNEYILNLTHDYRKDGAGEVKNEDETINVTVGSNQVLLPSSVGAYWEETTKNGNYFNGLEAAAIADIAYRLNGGLEFGVRLSHSFNDVTNNTYDFSRQANSGAPDYNRVPRTDVDRNLSIMFSIGFGL